MASVPKQIKIGHLNLKVIRRGMVDFDGLADFEKSKITIRSKLHKDRVKQTLIHECLHFICDNAGVEMSEENTDAIASALVCLLEDNETLVDYILDGRK